MIKIPEPEIRKRFQKLRNYEDIIYPRLKKRNDKLKVKIKEMKAENARLKKENEQIEKLQLQLEELLIMKFGKKRKNMKSKIGTILEEDDKKDKDKKGKKKERSAESYQRQKPNKDEVTDHLLLELKTCPECGDGLTDKKEHIHYREDLRDVEELINTAKKIVETKIESGKCRSCKKRRYAMQIPKHNVILGENLRRMVVFQAVMQGLSYTEVQKSLSCLYGMNISNGEVANILEGESRLLTPYYNYLAEELDKESKEFGAHYDETVWKTQSTGKEISEGNYCWLKIGVKSENRLIWFGRSRGKNVAELMRGDKEDSKGITDDYGTYKNCFESHGLCWAHPNRKLRDLAESGSLSGRTGQACKKTFKDFSKAYKKAEKVRKKLLAGTLDNDEKEKERTKLEKLFDAVTVPSGHDPGKLKTVRETLKKRKDRYFTFFEFPWLPLDNNKAERAIKRVVLKRKKSFGCRSQKGANVLSILYSVMLSLTETYPDDNFFSLYEKAVDFDETGEI